jgi:hypothetical protein
MPTPPRRSKLVPACHLIIALVAAAGCGVPGDPVPPSPPIPMPVTDLAATQSGDGILLTFTPPTKNTRSVKLTDTPTLEIFRGGLRPDGKPDPKSLHLVDTVPAPIFATYIQAGKAQYLEHFAPEELRGHAGNTIVFAIRTRVSERKSSADSNYSLVTLHPVPARIESLDTRVTAKSIDLSWTPPTQTSSGEPLPGPISFFVYRGELDPKSAPAAEKDLHAAVWISSLLQIATATAPGYQDTGFDWGKTYVYLVRTAVNENGNLLESSDSRAAILTPKDIFPPAAPQDLVAALLAGTKPGSSVVDLSWSINLETDLEGYRVYRSERENERGPLLTPTLLPSPAYRDQDVVPGHRYWYTVTAVDHAGNESEPSTPLLVEVP